MAGVRTRLLFRLQLKAVKCMKAIFRAVFYLRSNYVNKEGKTPVMLRIYLNNERLSIGSTGIAVQQSQWDREKERLKGRTTEALSTNLELDNIQSGLQTIFKKVEMTDEVSLERIKSEYLGKKEDVDTLMSLFNKHNSDVARQVGVSVEAATLQKYNVCKKHFSNFLRDKYGRSDIRLSELGYIVIHDFDIYLRTVVGQNPNTATRMMKTFKTITILGRKLGVLHHDPFLNIRFHMEPVNRGFLTDEEILKIANKDFGIGRLELVRDVFVFSCFTGLAYIDVYNLAPENIVTLNGKQWIMTKRQKTSVETNVLLLDIPKSIIAKYSGKTYRDGKLFPMLTNQKLNSYLKEIADICGIKKNLTFHLARHTFATMSLSKGVPIESVSKMLGHTNIKTTQIYARITNKKIEHDMDELADKLGTFNTALGISKK
ncbi:site-specific integrase [Prevotella intermedia]|jgi:site-specific recombinase XerD|nr:site-specific integrase [Prevotella intermedia]KXB76624.1 site-specific recombinase, phage integrase family [Prevotella amnii]OWP29116.1 integrase [Prevotella nigrescens]PMC07625.1 site-specific integrase [Hoylesella timonensis]ATV34006.1 site-specific integrase [Prevotella intermedia]